MRLNNINWHLVVVFILPLLIYLISMPLTVALEDDGLFILSSYFNGVSHPPGYPIHSFIGHLFSMIPVSTVAARVHAVSSVFGALTCVMVWLVIYDLIKDKFIASLGALSYAFSTVFWSLSLVAEVYTLNTFFFFSLLYLMIRINHLEEQSCSEEYISRLMYAAAFVFGLSLSNSWPLMLLSSPGFLILAWPTITRTPKVLIKATLFFVAGLFPYVWMVVNSQSDPLISFLGPIDSWDKFYYFVSREIYAPTDSSETSGLIDKILYCMYFIKEFSSQYTYAGFIFIVAGMIAQYKIFTKRVICALIASFIGGSFLIIAMLDFDYNELDRAHMAVYFLVPYGIGSLWLSVGAYYFFEYSKSYKLKNIPLLRYVFASFFVAIVMISHFDDNYRHDYKWGDIYATRVLESLPENVNFILTGKSGIGAIAYAHHVKGLRSDINIVTGGGVLLRNRIFSPYFRTPESNLLALEKYVHESDRPVYTTATYDELFQYDHWLTKSHLPGSDDNKVSDIYQVGDRYIDYVYGYNDTRDIWTVMHRRDLMRDSAPFVLGSRILGESRLGLKNKNIDTAPRE